MNSKLRIPLCWKAVTRKCASFIFDASVMTAFEKKGIVRIDQLGFGSVLCKAELKAIHRTEEIRDSLPPLERALGNYEDGRFAWQLENVELFLPPVPAKGRQGLFRWSPDEIKLGASHKPSQETVDFIERLMRP